MEIAVLVPAFVTLFVIIDPIGLMPIFVALTQGSTDSERRSIAVRSVAVAFGILILFAFLGEAVLGAVGISMAAFRIAGGALLFLTALDMLFERRTKRREHKAEDSAEAAATDTDTPPDPSVFPLAIPLISGPGSIATVILLAGGQPLTGVLAVIGVVFAVLCVVLVLFAASGLFERALGKTGIEVVTRLLGMLLAALAIQFILEGLRDFGFVG